MQSEKEEKASLSSDGKSAMPRETAPPTASLHDVSREQATRKQPWHRKLLNEVKKPGSAIQIIIAAVFAIALGLITKTQVEAAGKTIPTAALQLTGVVGQLWLRALKAVVLPLIITAMILAVQKLKEMTGSGARLAKISVGYYVCTTLIAITISCLMVSLVWMRQWEAVENPGDGGQHTDKLQSKTWYESIIALCESFIPDNVFRTLADNELLAVLITAVILGYLLDTKSPIVRAIREIEELVMVVINWLIKVAPIGVFFLIFSNLLKLDIASVGQNLGLLIAAALTGMFLHMFVVTPAIYFFVVRQNPYSHWIKCSPAWITAWGTASSAATLPVTLRVVRERGVPNIVSKFAIPLGCLINMDGTAIYFPVVVGFLAATQSITLDPGQWALVALLATLASIGTTPIPSASLVLTVMIAENVNVPVTGMFGVVLAIDWFLDRFRTAVNISSDLFGVVVIAKLSGLEDDDETLDEAREQEPTMEARNGPDRV
ncbi:hypothetical protein PQX77_006748 [Marasmius sp. AFHP31]|nr:hypothetical protein PQX77_006748 [Marasmius sp. AFHP31]